METIAEELGTAVLVLLTGGGLLGIFGFMLSVISSF